MELRMSAKERDRLVEIRRLEEGLISRARVAERLGLSVRQVHRLTARWRAHGDVGLIHRLRGRPSNRRIAVDVERRAKQILRRPEYHDFGPTLAQHHLALDHGIAVSDETVRLWMRCVGLFGARFAGQARS